MSDKIKLVKIKFVDGVSLRTQFGVMKYGDVIEVPESIAKSLPESIWQIEIPESKKEEK